MSLEFTQILRAAGQATVPTPLPVRRDIARAVLDQFGAMGPQIAERLLPDGSGDAAAVGQILRRAADLVLEGEHP